jgi:hypothetical protein
MPFKLKELKRISLLISILLVVLLVPSVTASENSFTIKITRDPTSFSSMNPDYISGIFTIEAQCEINLKWIAIVFNESIQKNETGSIISFKFSTDDYSEGEYEIKIFGETDTGLLIQSIQLTFTFKHRNTLTPYIVISILVIAAVAIIVNTYKNKRKSNHVKIDDVKIE